MECWFPSAATPDHQPWVHLTSCTSSAQDHWVRVGCTSPSARAHQGAPAPPRGGAYNGGTSMVPPPSSPAANNRCSRFPVRPGVTCHPPHLSPHSGFEYPILPIWTDLVQGVANDLYLYLYIIFVFVFVEQSETNTIRYLFVFKNKV